MRRNPPLLFGEVEQELSSTLELTGPVQKERAEQPDFSPSFLREATKLVYRLFRTPDAPVVSSVLFCGVDDSSNRNSVCWHTAEILAAQVPGSVCVVDANFRSPSAHLHFGVENDRGFTDSLLQPGPMRAFARQIPSGNLWVVPYGSSLPNGWVLFSPEQLGSRMMELRTLFDYVLVDVAPAGIFFDAAVLGQHVSGAVMVIEPNSTKRETAYQAKATLEAAKVRILGAVLHRRVSSASK
jgi:hypothetical protein